MLLTTLLVLTTLLPRLEGPVRAMHPALPAVAAWPGFDAGPVVFPTFQPEARAVSNWRLQAGENLRPAALALVARYAATDPAFVARCVKLNNYWCIKRARWNGEIGGDAEGHTGFATAADGSDAAAQLLRRYYRDLGRRNALTIVRRWAPAECRVGASTLPARTGTTKVSTALAPRGLDRTLRARYLARNTRGGVPRTALAARGGALRIQPWSPLARMGGHPRRVAAVEPKAVTDPKAVAGPAKAPTRVASAAAAGGRKPAALPAPARGDLLVRPSELLVKPSTIIAKPSMLLVEPAAVLGATSGRRATASSSLQERFVAESAALPSITAGLPLLDLSVPAPLCASDETRIRNYAGRIAASVGLRIEDDLKLFDAEGRPLPNLRPVMLAMSSVELGSLRATPALVEAAIARLDATTLAALNASKP